jgi:chromosome segregation ATPase
MMTDIVEQVRKAASQGFFYLHNSLVYELIAEIERLRAELKDANGIIRSQTISFRKHQAELRETATQEIERLKGELDLERRRLATSEELRTGLVGEIERLQADCTRLRDQRYELADEIERLQAEVLEWQGRWDDVASGHSNVPSKAR